MRVAVGYWHDPEAVVWVWVGSHRRLQGFDNYWVSGCRYGMWNDPENMGAMYEGVPAVAWEWDGRREREIDPTPPGGARVWRGVMLTDEQARWVGLL